jgi:hypothetical protein
VLFNFLFFSSCHRNVKYWIYNHENNSFDKVIFKKNIQRKIQKSQIEEKEFVIKSVYEIESNITNQDSALFYSLCNSILKKHFINYYKDTLYNLKNYNNYSWNHQTKYLEIKLGNSQLLFKCLNNSNIIFFVSRKKIRYLN